MTVEELINELSKYNKDEKVVFHIPIFRASDVIKSEWYNYFPKLKYVLPIKYKDYDTCVAFILDGITLEKKDESVEGAILRMIADNKENYLAHPLYNYDGYAMGYADGYNNALVNLLNKLGIEHDERIINGESN